MKLRAQFRNGRWQGGLALLACLVTLAGPAQADEEAQLKAAFVYRFAQLTQWPPPPQQDFNYCLYGRAELMEAMRANLSRAHDGATPHLTLLSAPPAPGQCQLLMLSLSDRTVLQHWQAALHDDPVLVVGDSCESFRAGAVVSLIVEPNGLAFRINLTEARRRGLTLSSQLLKLAREVR